ncbi:cytochrome P450 monooxygenase [Sphaerosporella brunnea]|uniref:Cytochrome P450 monooxygenase n=1 Tax=Sphaerosporella brunnea TaxID=1250544 RepID=A0A5J5ERQ0_9PEZI|nr:cytochrome P450 monooxygenase [Sphaerosporella brunnea]
MSRPAIHLSVIDADATHTALSIVGLAVAAFGLLVVYRRFFHPLAHFPGPFWASVSSLYGVWAFVSGGEHLIHRGLHEKYGPVVRFGPNELIVNDPYMLPLIYHRKADKTEVYAPNFGIETVFTWLRHQDHVAAKRRIAHAYSLLSIKNLEEYIDECLAQWISALSDISKDPSKPINFARWAEWFTYDVISYLSFGEPIGFIAARADVRDLIKNYSDASMLLEILALLPKVSWWMRKTWVGRKFLMAKAGDRKGVGVIMAERDRIFEKHTRDMEKGDGSKGILLTKFIAAKNADGTPMSTDDVKAEALLAMIAGSSTTSNALVRLIFNILQHPSCLSRLTAELDAITPTLTSPIPTFEEARTLPFLSACIRETFRYSPSTVQFPRVSDGLELNGKWVPAGTSVSASPWIMHRNKEMYGEDADTFRPDRWLEANAETTALWDKYDFRWGYGARKCLGRNIALMEIYKATILFFKHFRPELVEEIGFTSSGGPKSTTLYIHPRN